MAVYYNQKKNMTELAFVRFWNKSYQSPRPTKKDCGWLSPNGHFARCCNINAGNGGGSHAEFANEYAENCKVERRNFRFCFQADDWLLKMGWVKITQASYNPQPSDHDATMVIINSMRDDKDLTPQQFKWLETNCPTYIEMFYKERGKRNETL